MIRMVRFGHRGEILEIWEGTPAQYQRFIAGQDRTGWVGR
jgi:hypothetical protein